MRAVRLFLPLLLMALAGLSAHAVEVYRGPYLQQASSNDVYVVWRTDDAIDPVVRYGTDPNALHLTASGDAVTVRVAPDVDAPNAAPLFEATEKDLARADEGKFIETIPGTWQYEVAITGLEPSTKYYYAVYDGDTILAGGGTDYFFKTYQPEGSPADLRIWVVGDSGTGERDQAMVHEAMQGFVEKTNRPLDLYLHVGDMAYGDGTDKEFQKNFFVPYSETLRNTVCWPTMGNHEGNTSWGTTAIGPYYDAYVVPTAGEVGGAPSGTEAYYAFDIANVHFVCLDSHDLDRSPDAPMAQWLRADLEQADAQWLIAFWHHPPYTKGSHDSDIEGQLIEMRENFMPILEAAGVDLVLTGHSHIYERSMLMDGAYDTPTTAEGVILDDGDGRTDGDGPYRKSAGLHPHEGSVNIVSGHGGGSISRRGTMPVMREIVLEYGSVLLDIQGDTLKSTMVDKFGETRDVFTLVKRGTVEPREPIQDPWQPEHDVDQISRFRFGFEEFHDDELPHGWKVVRGADDVHMEEGKRCTLVTAGKNPAVAVYEPLTIADFEYEVLMRLGNDAGAGGGIVFGYEDPKNYWTLVVCSDKNRLTLSRITDGETTVVKTAETEVKTNRILRMETNGGGRRIAVEFEDDVPLRTLLSDAIPEGGIGFVVEAGATAEFIRFDVERD